MSGQIIGKYKLVEKLGEGGMGEVYRGVNMMVEREVAIKFLRPELAGQPQVVERFRSEAVTLAKLNHPNIATLYDFDRQGDSFIMVLEFVRGVTLDDVLQNRGAIPVDQATARATTATSNATPTTRPTTDRIPASATTDATPATERAASCGRFTMAKPPLVGATTARTANANPASHSTTRCWPPPSPPTSTA